MCRTYEHDTKARLSFSGGPHALVNMVDSMEEVNVSGNNAGNGMFASHTALYAKVSQLLAVLRDFHCLF